MDNLADKAQSLGKVVEHLADPSPTRRQVLERFRCDAILAAARKVIAAKGLAAATMDEIAEAAGIAKGTIYLYFKNKRDLFQEVVAHALGRLVAELDQINRSGGDAVTRLAQMLHLLLMTLEREEAFFRVYSTEFPVLHFYQEEAALKVRELDRQFTAILAEVIEQGMTAGLFQEGDPQQMAYILRGMVRAVALYKLVESQPASLLESLPLLQRLAFFGLRQKECLLTGED